MKKRLGIVLLVQLCLGLSAWAGEFKVTGIGGAGGMYTPAASPYDKNLMLVSCDMGGNYRSVDGGRHWELIPCKQLVTTGNSCYPVFLKDGSILWPIAGTIKMSRDSGKTWTTMGKPLGGAVTLFGVFEAGQAGNKDVVFLAHVKNKGIQRSEDMGETWKQVLAMDSFSMAVVGKRAYVGAYLKLHVSADAGATWEMLNDPLVAGKTAHGLGGAEDKNGSIVYAAMYAGGIAKSTDGGKTWKTVMEKYEDQKAIMVPWNQTKIAYMAQASHGLGNGKVWKTADAGETWKECFKMNGPEKNVALSWVQTQLGWGYYITDKGFGMCPTDPNVLMLTTQGDFYVSRDGGTTWQQMMNEDMGVLPGDPGRRYRCNGLEVTSSWGFLFDPLDKDRRYIAYTDIGFARSVDKGETWISSAAGCPWGNTFYQVVCDPDVKGRLYAATASMHDIPNWGFVEKVGNRKGGGVCVSDNGGVSWKVLGKGLPLLPCTSICLDPKSPKENRTIYAAMFESGCWKSVDGGQTWVNKSSYLPPRPVPLAEGGETVTNSANLLGNPGNLHVLKVYVHPKTGHVYCGITAFQEGSKFTVPGGLWKSTDGGDNWTDLTKDLKLHWPGNFAVNPENPNVIYLTAATIPGGREGGVYGTTDGGKTWTRLLKDEDFAATGGAGYVHCFYVNIDPSNPDHVYLGTNGHGLWFSADAGKTWKRVEDFPFASVTNVTFDPDDANAMYVCTFGGGVWRGPRLP